jgi:hypothetical protein
MTHFTGWEINMSNQVAPLLTLTKKFVCIARSNECKCTATAYATLEMQVTKLQVHQCSRTHDEKMSKLMKAAESAVLLMAATYLDAIEPV